MKLNWAEPLPGSVGFIPHLGVVLERRDAGGGSTTDGTWSSTYVGSKFSYKLPVGGLKGFGLTALARWYGDLSVPDGNEKRRAWFGKLKATYDLYENKTSTVKPTLFVSRQAGTDVLSGTTKAKTQFGIQVTIN